MTTQTAAQPYFVQAIQGDRFEDLYVDATSWEDAVRQARALTKLDARWATFAC